MNYILLANGVQMDAAAAALLRTGQLLVRGSTYSHVLILQPEFLKSQSFLFSLLCNMDHGSLSASLDLKKIMFKTQKNKI